ncbi:unnamed protein product [Arctia plantaginis]|uniref:Uncharacterized protein n=1 Tax=Arctia plantaginis TaxID=874455 RepID=A0A8S1AT24_ARCPL|nr:unnamed protein product [Arctia plantaginis]
MLINLNSTSNIRSSTSISRRNYKRNSRKESACYKYYQTRPNKICFSSEETAKTILRSRIPDQTSYQNKYLQDLKENLQKRTPNGKTDLSMMIGETDDTLRSP